jgi:uncharacterized damage-inducible protein DinB
MDSSDRLFLEYSARKLRQATGRIEDCLGRLSEVDIWSRATDNENAVGNLVLHLSGNVRQWIVAGVGARPDTRQRDAEFAARGGLVASGLAALLRGIVEEAAAIIEALAPERLCEPLMVQSYNVTVLEAIYHVVEHFSGHTGQIIYATKLLTGKTWDTTTTCEPRQRMPSRHPDACYFLKSLSKALRAASGEVGASTTGLGGGAEALPSRATVTRGENSVHSLALSFSGIRTGMGFRHWNRVDGSKWEHCLQQCSATLHFGQLPFQSIPFGSCVEQLKQRAAVTA